MIDKIFGEKVEGVSYYDRKGAYLISIKNNMVLTVETHKGYFLLGGGIDNNETQIDCIKRECIEEIGYSVIVKDYICSAEEYQFNKEIGYFHPIQYYYSGEIIEQIAIPIENDHKLKWITIDNIENKMYLKMQGFAIKKYLETIK